MKWLLALMLAAVSAVRPEYSDDGYAMRLVNFGDSLEYCLVVFYNGAEDRFFLRANDRSRWYIEENVYGWECRNAAKG